LELELAIMFV